MQVSKLFVKGKIMEKKEKKKRKRKKNTRVAIFRNSRLLPRSKLNLENVLTYHKTHRTDFN